MSGPHFRIDRYKGGFNAVPCSPTGWAFTVGFSALFLLLCAALTPTLVLGILSLWVFSGTVLLLTGLYCWILIAFALKNGEDVEHR